MSRLKARAAKKRQEAQTDPDNFWQDLAQRINAGQVIPIISNSVRSDRIFDIDDDQIVGLGAGGDEDSGGLSIEEQLSEAWAVEIGYPLPDKHKLARVAQYNRVKSRDDLQAKAQYLHFLKDTLLYLAEDDEKVDPETIEELQHEIDQSPFSDIAHELEYPRFDQAQFDPLHMLAQLNLPIYVTTSYFDFMERALQANGRTPRTQICFWSGEPVEFRDDQHRIDPDFVPSKETPLVYHLYGLESYPASLVLSEDDYLDFLTKVSQDTSQENPIVPWYLRKALTQSSLLLLGYRLQDWEFRVLFRGIINTTPASLRKFSLAIQLDPKDQHAIVTGEQAEQDLDKFADEIKQYLKKYFGSSNFNVEWGDTDTIVKRLWEEWQRWR